MFTTLTSQYLSSERAIVLTGLDSLASLLDVHEWNEAIPLGLLAKTSNSICSKTKDAGIAGPHHGRAEVCS